MKHYYNITNKKCKHKEYRDGIKIILNKIGMDVMHNYLRLPSSVDYSS